VLPEMKKIVRFSAALGIDSASRLPIWPSFESHSLFIVLQHYTHPPPCAQQIFPQVDLLQVASPRE